MSTLNQTLQEKFPHLEVSVLKLSEVQRDNETKRIDSEYFKKEYLENEKKIKGKTIILNFIDTKIQNIKSFNLNKNFNYLQISDIDLNNGLTYSTIEIDFVHIPDRATYILQKNDICVSTVRPNRNAVALIKNQKRLIGTSGFCVLRLKEKNILPEFLYIFCKTDFFITKMMRANTASLYPAVSDSDIYKCKIPLLPMPFQLEIEKLVKDSHSALEDSKALYKQAEDLLYTELGLNPQNPMQSILQPHSNNINFRIATLKESFLKTGRLDSEYYQVKYEKFEALIKNYKNGWDCVKTFFSQNNTSCNFSKSEYKYIEIGDINTNSGIASYNTIQTNELPANAKMAVAKDDILISKVRPYRGAVAIIDFKAQDIVASGAFAVLREKGNFKKEVLQVLLRTSIYKEWLLKWNVGTSYPVIKDEDILNLPIPKIDLQTQDSIASHIQQSFTLRAEAKALLNEAKAKVESAISGGGGGVNNASFVAFRIQIFRIYLPQIKAKLRDSKRSYRLGEWELLEELLFSQTTTTDTVINYTIATLKQTLGTSGRLDSEYYQSKYDILEHKIKSHKGGYCRLKEIGVFANGSFIPESCYVSNSQRAYIRIKELSLNMPIKIQECVYIDDSFKATNETIVKEGDFVFATIGNTIGKVNLIPKELEGSFISNNTSKFALNDKNIKPHFLELLLRSILVQEQIQREFTQTAQPKISNTSLENLLIPLLELSIQETIESKITQSFALRAKSKELLEEAKAKVEEKISLL